MVVNGMGEAGLRFGVFAAVFAVLAVAELARPKRRPMARKMQRWATNLAIAGIDGGIVKVMGLLAVPLAGTAAAAYAGAHGLGVLNSLALPSWLAVTVTVVVLDFAIWLQHVATHKVPLLWRLHQVHHADVDFDVTTAIRFHPIEIALSVLWKVVCVLILGPPVAAVVLFEIILNACAMFSHANIDLPPGLDRVVRALFVTPDMHRVHHSILRHEHDSNYGFNLSVWDRVFGTYVASPEKGHDAMTIGLRAYKTDEPTTLFWSLKLPFLSGGRERRDS